jgi:hypothetical protein
MREFTYRHKITVSSQDLNAARSGQKTCTIRLGSARVAADELDLSDRHELLRVKIVDVQRKQFGELGDNEVRGEGFASLAELQADLKHYYPAISADSLVTVIWFEPLR